MVVELRPTARLANWSAVKNAKLANVFGASVGFNYKTKPVEVSFEYHTFVVQHAFVAYLQHPDANDINNDGAPANNKLNLMFFIAQECEKYVPVFLTPTFMG